MTSWMKALLIGGGATAGAALIAAAVYFGLPYLRGNTPTPQRAAVTSSSSPDFVKTAYQVDSNGNLVLDSNGDPIPFTGPAHPGDQIEYVLTYKAPTGSASGPVTITDTLSANQTYVDPSIQAPPGWTYATSPGYPGNSETYSNPGFGPGAGLTMDVAPIGPSVGTTSGVHGDGFQPVPVAVAGRVYSLWHHMPNPQPGIMPGVMCWNLSDLTPCPGYQKLISAAGGGNILTPNWPHVVVVGTKFYFPAGLERADNATADLGIGCWDTVAEAACPFIMLPGSPTFAFNWLSITTLQYGFHASAHLAGIVTDPTQPSHLIINANDQIYCIDASTSTPCSAWTNSPSLAFATTAGDIRDMIADGANATRVLVLYNGKSGSPRIACRLLATGANCPGWATIGGSSEVTLPAGSPSSVYKYATLSPVPNSPTSLAAVCAHQYLQGKPACVNVADGSSHSMPAIFTNAVAAGGTGIVDNGNGSGEFNGTNNSYYYVGSSAPPPPYLARYVIAAFQIPGTQKVLYPYYVTRIKPYCFDFAANSGNGAPCAGFSAAWNSMNNSGGTPAPQLWDTRDYGYAADPADPEHCLLGLGDHEVIWRFRDDGSMGRGVCVQQHVQQTFDINASFCAKKPKQATWTNVEIVGRPSELVGGTIVIKDSSGTVVQTIPVTGANSYAVNLPASGANATLTVEFNPDYGTNTPPTGAYQIKLDYSADVDPQICYRTTVQDCAEGAPLIDISNHAVYTDALGTKDADVNLGKVVGGHCGPPPCMDLTGAVTLNPNGTGTLTITGSGPPGFTATMLDVHSNTPGVTVLPPSRTVPPGPINATFALTGITPGQTIDIQIDAVDPGAGTNGSDKCCSTMLTVVVPRDDHHHHTDVAIQKTGVSEGQGPANGSGYVYTLSVTNISDPINGQNAVVVTDVVPAGLSFASAGGTDWNCPGPFPIGPGGTLTCTYVGTGTVATGQALPPITVVSTNANPAVQLPSVTNCAVVNLTPASGLTDYEPSNNRSCVTNDAHSQTGSLTVIKTVEPARGYPVPSMAFQAHVICTPLGGSPSATTLTLSAANAYTQTVSNLTAGTSCTVTETPLSSGLPKECHWTTTYPDGQQATIPAGNVTRHIDNREECTTSPTDGPTVLVDKVVVIDGKVTYVPRQSFPIRGTCRTPDGGHVSLNFTASAARGLTSPKQIVPEGSRCTVSEPMPPPPPGRSNCHWETTYQFNGRPVHGFPVAIGDRDSNIFTVRNVLVCEQPDGPHGGNPTDRLCSGAAHWNGKRCVTCNADETWDDQAKICTVPRLVCHDPMVPNAAGTACVCKKGMELKDGKCRKSESFLDDVFGHVHIGIGVGGSGGGSRGHPGGGDPGPRGGK